MERASIAQLMPAVLRRTAVTGSPLAALLEAMEALHEPIEDVLGHLDAYFDPRRAPDEFVTLLASWVNLSSLLSGSAPDGTASGASLPSGHGRLRELVANAAYLSQWRGTASGILRFLEIATGESGFAIDEDVADDDGRPRAYHIRVVAPAPAERYRDLIDRILELEKPAYVTYELDFAS